MGDPKGFLTTARQKLPRRPVELRLRDYKHVYMDLAETEVRAQAARCMDCGVPFCNTGCPVHNLIPDWNDLVYRDRWHDAIDRLHMTNNFPEFTGMLCPAPCENACVLSINDQPVNIKEIERSIIERAWAEGWVRPEPPSARTGKRVAVVGSGPAGLAAAQQLNRAGHSITVFEKDDVIGGLLVYGIPDFKIEKWMVERRVEQLVAEGIEFRTNSHVGVSPSLDVLKSSYDAVVLAVGALAGRDLPVPGRELDGIHMAMDYLTQQNRRVSGRPIDAVEITARDKHVVILGGGDTGADCLGNANREQCASVQILTRGPQPPSSPSPLEWPDVPFVLRTWPAHEEGGERRFDVLVESFLGEGNKVTGLSLRDRNTNEHYTLPADLVLLAIGFSGPVQDDLISQLQPSFTDSGAIACDESYRVNERNIFVTGDAMRGASLIVWAIADGRNVANAVDNAIREDLLR